MCAACDHSTGIRSSERRTCHGFQTQSRRHPGASQGIGAGLVRGFLDRGFRVVANRGPSRPAIRRTCWPSRDIADPAVADRVIGSAIEAFGRVDTLVNDAGIFISKPFTD